MDSMFVAMTTTLPPDGARLASSVGEAATRHLRNELDVEATEMLIAAMRYSRTESLRSIYRVAESLRLLGLPPNLVLTRLLGTLASVIAL